MKARRLADELKAIPPRKREAERERRLAAAYDAGHLVGLSGVRGELWPSHYTREEEEAWQSGADDGRQGAE